MKRLAVYCGASTPHDSRLVAIARQTGETLARRGIGVVYGGARVGLMGAVAAGALAAGGRSSASSPMRSAPRKSPIAPAPNSASSGPCTHANSPSPGWRTAF